MVEPVQMLIVRFMLKHPAELKEAYRLAFPLPAPSGLTFRQRQLLDFIEAFETEKGFSPSFDEMKEAIGLKSKSGIARLVDALEERGFIAKRSRKGRARALVLVEKRA